MNHLDFVDKLNQHGVSIRSTNTEGEAKEIEIVSWPNIKNSIIVQNGEVKWRDRDSSDPLYHLIKKAIDIDEWKHSWYTDIKLENYDEIQEIIQKKIIERSSEIDFLLTVYFQINREKSKNETGGRL